MSHEVLNKYYTIKIDDDLHCV